MTRNLRLVAAALAVLLLAGVGAAGCTDKSIVATVDGVPIKVQQIDTQLAQIKQTSPQTFEGTAGVALEANYRARILDSLIQLELVNQAAKNLGVAITDAQVNDYIKQLEAQYGGASGLDAAIKQSGLDRAQLSESVRNRLLVESVSTKVAGDSTKTTDAQILKYYETNKGQFAVPVDVNAQHILFAGKDKALAQQVLVQAKGGADFAALAKKYSTDPGSKDKGGNLGWAQATNYVPEFRSAVETMKVGSYNLVQSQYGWHVIKLLGRRGGQIKPLSEVKSQIEQTLQSQAQAANFTKYVAALRKKAAVEIIDPTLKKAVDALNASAQAAGTQTP